MDASEQRVYLKRQVLGMDLQILLGKTSFVKTESLYAYYNAMLIQKINFLRDGEKGWGGGVV